MHNTSHGCRGQVGMVISMGVNNPEACRWYKSPAQCFADRWVWPQRGQSKGRETTQELSSKNETPRILLVSQCFGYVNVSGYVPLQRVAAGLSTHVFLFCLLQWLSRLNTLSLLEPSFPFSPLLSSSSIFLAALTSRFQKIALHRLLVQRKTFRVNWSAIFMLASLAGAPDEGQFDTPLSQSAWIRAPLGQARLVLVLVVPSADR